MLQTRICDLWALPIRSFSVEWEEATLRRRWSRRYRTLGLRYARSNRLQRSKRAGADRGDSRGYRQAVRRKLSPFPNPGSGFDGGSVSPLAAAPSAATPHRHREI